MLTPTLRGDCTIPQVAELFGVSIAFVNKLLRLHRAGEDLAPRPHGGGHIPRLGARHHRLPRAAVAANNDATPGELREHPAAKSRVTVSGYTVSRALKALWLPRKKKHEGGGAQQL